MKNLYNAKEVFRLIINGVETVINEPVGWDSVSMNLSRDMDLYGIKSEFVKSDTVSLKFPFGQGYELLKDLYKTYGSDAYAEFSFSYLTKEGIESQEFLGVIDFNNYGDDGTFVYANIEKRAFNSLLNTRFDTKVSLNAKETLDGETLPVTDLIGSVGNYNGEPVSYQNTFDPTSFSLYLQHDATELLGTDIREFQVNPLAVQTSEPVYEDNPQIIVEKTGYYTFNSQFSGIFKFNTVDLAGSPVASAPITVRPYFKVYRGSSFVVDVDYGTYTITTTSNNQSNSVNINDTRSLTLNAGDKVMFGVRFFINSSLGKKLKAIDISNYQNVFSLSKVATESDYPFRGFVMKLHSKEIVQYSETKTPPTEPDTYSETGLALTDSWLQLDTETVLASQIDGFVNVPLGVITNNPMDTDQYIFKSVDTGNVDCEWSFTGRFRVPGFTGASLTYTPALIIKKAVDGTVTIRGYSDKAVTVVGDSFSGDDVRDGFTMAFEVTDRIYVEPDDQVYFGCRINCATIAPVNITNAFSYVKVSQSTVQPATTCRVYNLFDTINFVAQIITGESNRVQSSFLNACGKNYSITNGFQIRNFEVFERPVQVSMSDLAEICKIWNLGIGIKTDGFGTDYIIVEPMETFFSGDEITTLTNLYDYKEEHEKDLVFNEITIGYDKFATDDDNYLDDIHTEQSILLPIKTHKNKKEVKVSAIASGYLIEQQRREQFADTPSKSVANDDDIFIISYIKGLRQYYNVAFEVLIIEGLFLDIPLFRFNRPVGMQEGDRFRIIGGSGDNEGITFTVSGKDLYSDSYAVSPTPTVESGVCTVQVLLTAIEAERNENYQTTNILNPASCYNLAITPKQMLFWWKDYFNIGLTQKAKSDVIKTTFVKQNTKATITPLSTSDCEVLPASGISMMGDISIETYGYLQRSFMPSLVRFKCPMTYETYLLIKQAVRGELSANSSNFGYIVFEDYDGVQWQAHLKNLEYNPSSQIATIECYKIGLN